MTEQYVMYFRFCGWHHVSHNEPYSVWRWQYIRAVLQQVVKNFRRIFARGDTLWRTQWQQFAHPEAKSDLCSCVVLLLLLLKSGRQQGFYIGAWPSLRGVRDSGTYCNCTCIGTKPNVRQQYCFQKNTKKWLNPFYGICVNFFPDVIEDWGPPDSVATRPVIVVECCCCCWVTVVLPTCQPA